MGTSQSSFHYDDDNEYAGGHDVILSIPSTVKPRPKIGAGNQYQRSQAKNKNESLRSALTVDIENIELEKIRKEFDFYKLNIENEMTNFSKKERKLETDNRKLKTELQAMQKTCKRLREERDIALESERQAHQRAAAIELDRNKIQRQFKVFRESKESELQCLYKSKQDLETKLDSISSKNDGLDKISSLKSSSTSCTDMWTIIDQEFNIDQSKHIESDYSLIKNLASNINGLHVNFNNDRIFNEFELYDDENNLLNNSFYLINIIFSTYNSSINIIDEYMKNYYSGLQHLCNKCKKLLNMNYLPLSKNLTHYINLQVHQRLFFLYFAEKEDFESLSDFETFLSLIYKKNVKSIIFVHSTNYKWFISKNSFCNNKSITYQIVQYNSLDQINVTILELLNEYLINEISEDLIVLHDDLSYWTMLQNETKNSYLCNTSNFDIEKDLEKLNKQMSLLGPMAPVLIVGSVGCGKSTLLSNWIEKNTKNENALVLYYFVDNRISSSSSFMLIIRYLMIKMIRRLDIDVDLSTNTNQLLQDLPKFIDKISSRFSGGICLVIDSVDKINDFCKYFDWLLDPLPLDFRIIISIDEENIPLTWKSWPTIEMRGVERPVFKSFFKNINNLESDDSAFILFKHCSKSHLTAVPLYLTLVESALNCDFLKIRKEEIIETFCVSDMYNLILRKLAFYFATRFHQKDILLRCLSLVILSYEGLFDYELKEIICFDNNSYFIISSTLLKLKILKYSMGRLIISNDKIRHILEKLFISDEYAETSKMALIEYLNSHGYLDLRNSFEFPRLFSSQEYHLDLKACLLNLPLISHLLKRCQTVDIMSYWVNLGIQTIQIAKIYDETVKSLDNSSIETVYTGLVIAKFISDIDCIQESISIVQHSLELLSSSTDPDNPLSGTCLQLLADLYDKQRQHNMAELMHRQALDVLESCLPSTHSSILNQIKRLVAVYEKNGKENLSNELRKKLTTLKFNQKLATFKLFVKAKLNDLDKNNDNVDSENADYYNEMAQLYYYCDEYRLCLYQLEKCLQIWRKTIPVNSEQIVQLLLNIAAILKSLNQPEKAVGYLDEALIMCEKEYDSGHPLILSTIKNLVSLHNDLGNTEQSIRCHQLLLEQKEQVLGHQHPNIALASANLAVYLSEKGDYDSAETLFKKALSIYTEAEGNNEARIASTLKNLALLKYHQGNFNEAVLLYSNSSRTNINVQDKK